MKQLSYFLAQLFTFFYLSSNAQTDIQHDRRVDPMLKQVAAKHPGLTILARKDKPGKYVNMAVLADSTRTLTWFTCYGQAFEAIKLTDDAYAGIKSGSLDPFHYYKSYFFDLLSHVKDAAARFRQMGQFALTDTNNIYYRIYSCPTVQQAHSTLQKEVAIEKLMSGLCLQLSLFDSKSPQLLTFSDSFQLRLQLAGKRVRKEDTITYYNTNPLSSASRIVLYKHTPGKMFIYGQDGQPADSVPLKADKYAALLNEKEDVFLLYRGWLELQSQQAIAGKEDVDRLLNREYTMLHKPVSWEQQKQELQQTFTALQERIDEIGNKVMGLIVPSHERTAQLLAAVYPDKPAEISYLPGLSFAYSISYSRGQKRYELSDHRGNVMAVVSDSKRMVDENGDGDIEYYYADVADAADYLPFGGQMPGRAYSSGDKYRYGFNGKENDNEVKGEGNQLDYGFRIYDPRIGRFLSVDPLTQSYPWYTPYQFAGNKPIVAIDLDGLEELIVHQYFNQGKLSKIEIMRYTDVNGQLQNNQMIRLADGHKVAGKVLTFNHRGNTAAAEAGIEQDELTKTQQDVLNKNLSVRSFSYENGGYESFSGPEYAGQGFRKGNFIRSSGTVEYPVPAKPRPVLFGNQPIRPGVTLSDFKGSNNYYIGVSNFPGAGDLGDEIKGSLSKLGRSIDQAGNIKTITVSLTQVVGSDITAGQYDEAERQANVALGNIMNTLDKDTKSKVKIVNGGVKVLRSNDNASKIKDAGTHIKLQ